VKSYFAKRNIFNGKVAWNSYLTHGLRHIESSTGGSTRYGNLRHPRVRFQSFSFEACRVRERLQSYPRVSDISLSCTFSGVWFYFSLNTQLFFFTFHRAFSRNLFFHCWSKYSIYPYATIPRQYFKCISS
jgi:hypothetical protein